MKKTIALLECLCLLMCASACGNVSAEETAQASQTEQAAQTSQTSQSSAAAQSVEASAESFPNVEVSASDSPLPSGTASIMLNGDTAEASSSTVQVSGGTITITEAGTYMLSGSLTNGTVIVDADKSDKVELILNGADISADSFAAIYVKQADKVKIELAEDSSNVLTGGNYVKLDDNSVDAVIFSKDDLTFSGSGTLAITANTGHGIVTKDDLKIKDGNFVICAKKHAFSANDSIEIKGGSFNLVCGKDGFNCANDETGGDITIEAGSFKAAAEGDAFSAGGKLLISGGAFDIVSGGGSANASKNKDNSQKGLKAASDIVITDGAFAINSADDAVHSGAALTVSGGSFVIAAGDDAFHADETLTVKGGDIDISGCYEGLEGLTVDIGGGEIRLNASDDGINAAGGRDGSGFGGMRGGKDRFGGGFDFADGGFPGKNKGDRGGFDGKKPDMQAPPEMPQGGEPPEMPDMPQQWNLPNMPVNAEQSDVTPSINISGGRIFINADGDGVDSNGTLNISGGELYISGPTSSMNGALDFESTGTITGGTVIAAGASGMAQNFGTASQGSIYLETGRQDAGTEITVTSASGEVIARYTAEKRFECVVISAPALKVGQTCTVTAGSFTQEVTLDKEIYGEGFGGFGNFGGFGGGHGRGFRENS